MIGKYNLNRYIVRDDNYIVKDVPNPSIKIGNNYCEFCMTRDKYGLDYNDFNFWRISSRPGSRITIKKLTLSTRELINFLLKHKHDELFLNLYPRKTKYGTYKYEEKIIGTNSKDKTYGVYRIEDRSYVGIYNKYSMNINSSLPTKEYNAARQTIYLKRKKLLNEINKEEK